MIDAMKKWYVILSVCALSATLSSCVEELKTENFYTFTGETITDYVENRESLSMFKELLERTTEPNMFSLLDAYGQYTCFAPHNDAFEAYLKERGVTSVNELRPGECDTIARNHIIKVAYPTTDMPEDVLSQPNMNDRYIQISIDSGNIYVNIDAQIVVRDEEVENGVVHVLDKVLQQSNAMFTDLLRQDSRISLFYKALEMTGFEEKLNLPIMDPDFEPYKRADGLAGFNDRRTEDNSNLICPVLYPMNRKIGFTGFIESNETFAKAGIDTTSIDGLIAYAKEIYEGSFPDDKGTYKEDEYTNPKHPLYRFVAYHFLDRQIYTDKMTTYFHFQQNSYDAVDFYETMCKGTIVKVARGGKTQGQTRLNRRYGLSHGQGYSIQGVPVQNVKHDGINGVYYLIDEPLVYSKDVIKYVLTDRMRFDASTLMPELATNNIFRNGTGATDGASRGHSYQIPNTMEYSYVKNLKVYQESIVYYQAPVIGFWCWYADEIIAKGSYDFAIKLPPVPSGTYEIRYGYVPMGHRGVVQVYLEYDGKSFPCGIPIDLTEDGTSPKIGWVSDKDKTEDELLKLDKAMHNRGYLKGPLTQTEGSSKSNIARDQSNHLRRIVATENLENGTDYYIRFRSVDETAKEFMFDYLELCPKEVYDNPAVQEDRL